MTYKNPFYRAKYQDRPGGNIFDIVKDGICVGMNEGLNGAKKRIDEIK